MKKSLLALAALTAFAGAASAQSSVTLSGGVDLGIARIDGDTKMQTAGTSSRSNITLSGKEDLGGGMYASFFLNHRFNPQNGTVNPGSNIATGDNQFWRNSFVELGGGFGAVRLGRYLVPLQEYNGAFDAFGTDTVGSVHVNQTGNIRANSAVEYRTPSMGGFQVLAMMAEGTAASQGSRGGGERAAGLAARYKGGPVDVAVAWDKQGNNLKTTGIYGAYNIGAATIMGQYEKGDTTNPAVDRKAWSLSTKVSMGAADLKAGYRKDKDQNQSKLGLGVDYNLSKRTQLYTDLGKHSGNGYTATQRKTMFDVGVKHSF